MSYKCLKCSQGLSPEKEVYCDLCRKYIHSTCSLLSRNELTCLKAKNRILIYYCDNCTDFKSQLANLNCLQDTVKKLEAEINNLKCLNKSPPYNDAYVAEVDNLCNMDIVEELNERRIRESNIIIFNMEETGGTSNESKQKESDNIKGLIRSIDDSVNVNNVKHFRLGKYSEERKRPVKLILSSKEDVLKILKNKVKANPPVNIQSDQTPMQRKYLYDLRQQLQVLINNGEINKTIKYIKGKPQIVDAKN